MIIKESGGVLVAVSIPVFTSKLESSREAVDIANTRSAYAVAMTDVLTQTYNVEDSPYTKVTGGTYTGYYDVKSGEVVATSADVDTAYGKATADGMQGATPDLPDVCTYDGLGKGKIIKITITPGTDGDDTVEIGWEEKKNS